MKIGFVGLGRLGWPVAIAVESRGHEVFGWDTSEIVRSNVAEKKFPYLEAGPSGTGSLAGMVTSSRLSLQSVEWMTANCDIVFVAVQTPHKEEYEGKTRLPANREDFDYSFLKSAVGEINAWGFARGVKTRTAIISTVLPGTIRREILGEMLHCDIAYNPSFIAMSTVVRDFLFPEYVLIGSDDYPAWLVDFYRTITTSPIKVTGLESAECAKVAYNTIITAKITIVNAWMEIAHHVGADIDEISDALEGATRRVASGAYLRGGMGDAGGCHPRDNIALSWLSQKYLDYDIFGNMMEYRERQAVFLCRLLCDYPFPKVVLGYAYKPNVNLTAGSHALLCYNILEEMGEDVFLVDPVVEGRVTVFKEPQAFLIGCAHDGVNDYEFPVGSVVIDPFGIILEREGVEVISVGRLR